MGGRAVLLVVAVVIAVVATSVVALTAPAGIPAIDLVPQEAKFVAGIKIGQILTDEDIAEAYNEAKKPSRCPQTFDAALNRVECRTGLDLREFSEALVFGNKESEDYLGAIVKGSFVEDELIASIEEATGEQMPAIVYNDYQIYIITRGQHKLGICFLSDDTIAVGLMDVVKDVIDVAEGAPRLSGPVYDMYNSLGDAWVKVAAEMPEEKMCWVPEWEIPIGLEAFEDIEAVGFGFSKAGENLSIQTKLYFCDAESAADVKEMIGVAIGFLALFAPPDIEDIVDGIEVSSSGFWLTIKLETTVTEIEGLAVGRHRAFSPH